MFKLMNLILALSMLLVLGVAVGAQTISAPLVLSENFNNHGLIPDFSTNGATWNTSGGIWYDESSYFLCSGWTSTHHNRVAINFGTTAVGSPVEADFNLYEVAQGVGGYRIDFGLANSITGKSYAEGASTGPTYFGYSGFSQYDQWGNLTAGLSGAALAVGGGAWSYLKFIYTPGTGVQVYNASAATWGLSNNDPSLTYQLVANWTDYSNVQSVDTFFIDAQTMGNWYVQDVNVYATQSVPEPASLLALATGIVGLFGIRRRRD